MRGVTLRGEGHAVENGSHAEVVYSGTELICVQASGALMRDALLQN